MAAVLAVPAASESRARLGPFGDRPRGGGPVALRLKQPTVRIGLAGDGRVVRLRSAGGLHIVDRETGRDVWKHLHRGEVRVVIKRGGAPEPPAVFRVQVASLASAEEAEALRERLQQETGEGVQVSRNPDRNAWRVRVGQRSSREEIRQVEDRLRELGYAEIWVVQEASEDGRAPRLRLVDDEYNDMLTGARGLMVLPASEGRPVEVAEQPYRGVVEVLLTRARQLKAVNVLNVEEYLRGVVPREMGPSVYPELEALKAQAVAARTYAEANRGQFADEGYDICDSARCQVYGGLSAEHPLSDLAVEQTWGLILTYGGKPINALYTSTCGGHTEDIKGVFREMEGAYLKGVPCYPDEATLAEARRTLRSAPDAPPAVLPSGEPLDGALALLEVLGVLGPEEAAAAAGPGAPDAGQAGAWIRRTLQAVGRRTGAETEPAAGVGTVADLAGHLVRVLEWEERAKLLLAGPDPVTVLGEAASAAAPPESRAALAWLVSEGILPAPRAGVADGSGPRAPATRALLARALHRIVTHYEAGGLKSGRYRGSRGVAVGLETDGTLSFFRLASRRHLVLLGASGPQRVPDRVLQEGDLIAYHLAASGDLDYLQFGAGPAGAADDRSSSLYTWKARVARSELASRIRTRASIGDLVDVIAGPRGVSGRILELTVVGTAGRFHFRGFAIESLLGLRETLFVVDRLYAPDGRIETFVFSGKGWGHGVGLCQVGSYGMAMRGRSFEEILRHYYTGVELRAAGSH